MSQNLSGYITDVRRLLHDANANFYSDQQLTDYINSARTQVVRDTGCLRTIQKSQVPAPVATSAAIGGVTPTAPVYWTESTAFALNQFVFSNIFIYQVTQAGTTSTTPPPYPGAVNYPPNTQFLNGTCGLTYVGDCEKIDFSTLPSGQNTLDVLNVNLFWGNTRIPLDYLPWTDFNAKLRFWQNYIGRPLAFSTYGQSQLYVGPVPDQIYSIEIDTVILPTSLLLSAPTVADSIQDPYTSLPSYYAAHTAKYFEQSFGESEIFQQQYRQKLLNVLNSVYTRRLTTC